MATIVLLGAGCARAPLSLPLPEPLQGPAALERDIKIRNAAVRSLATFLPHETTGATLVFHQFVPLKSVPAILFDPQVAAEIAYLHCPDTNSQPPEYDLELPKYEKWDEIVPVIKKGWADLNRAAPRANDDCFSRNRDPLIYAFEIRGPATSLTSLLDREEVRLVDLEGYGHLSEIPRP